MNILLIKGEKAMKEKYTTPEVEIIQFDNEDVITTSLTDPETKDY